VQARNFYRSCRSGDTVTSQVVGGLDVPGTLRAEFWVTCRRAGGLTWRGGRGSRSPALWRRRADPAQAMDKSGRPGSSLDRIGVRRRPAIGSGPLLMILLFARCLLVCPGTTRQHPALAGIRSRWEVHEPAACGILHHRLAESNTCCSGLLIRKFKVTAERHVRSDENDGQCQPEQQAPGRCTPGSAVGSGART
jgi:hypothetical protein